MTGNIFHLVRNNKDIYIYTYKDICRQINTLGSLHDCCPSFICRLTIIVLVVRGLNVCRLPVNVLLV